MLALQYVHAPYWSKVLLVGRPVEEGYIRIFIQASIFGTFKGLNPYVLAQKWGV